MRLFNSNEQDTNKNKTEGHIDAPHISLPAYGERMVEEDALLVQIDSFREKAQTLQSLINERQDKVLELEGILKEKESQNEELAQQLAEKQDALDSVLDDIKGQLDVLADRIDTSMHTTVKEAKEPIMEKIHTENVRLYRNLYDFVKEDYDMTKMEGLIKENKPSKGPIIFTLILTLINTGALIYILTRMM